MYTVRDIGEDIAGLFMSATALFVTVLTPIIGDIKKDPITPAKVVGTLIGFSGVGIVTAASFLFGQDRASQKVYPYLVFLAGVFIQGCALTLWKRFNHLVPKSNKKEILGMREILGVYGQNLVGGLCGLIGAFAVDWDHPPYRPDGTQFQKYFFWTTDIQDPMSIFCLLWYCVISAVVVALCNYYLVSSLGAAFASSATCGCPVVALVEGIIFLDVWAPSKITIGGKILQGVGTVMVIGGLLISFLCSRKKPPAPKALIDVTATPDLVPRDSHRDSADIIDDYRISKEIDQ